MEKADVKNFSLDEAAKKVVINRFASSCKTFGAALKDAGYPRNNTLEEQIIINSAVDLFVKITLATAKQFFVSEEILREIKDMNIDLRSEEVLKKAIVHKKEGYQLVVNGENQIIVEGVFNNFSKLLKLEKDLVPSNELSPISTKRLAGVHKKESGVCKIS